MRPVAIRVATVTAIAAVAAVTVTAVAVGLVGVSASGIEFGSPAQAVSPEVRPLEIGMVTSGELFPGGAVDVTVTVRNPNPHQVTVTDLVAGDITSDLGACGSATGVRFDDQHGLAQVVPPLGEERLALAGALRMDNSSVDGCRGAVFTVPITVSGEGLDDPASAAGPADAATRAMSGWLASTGTPVLLVAGLGGGLLALGVALRAWGRFRRTRPRI